MSFKKQLFFMFFVTISSHITWTMQEKTPDPTQLVIVPGQNGNGGTSIITAIPNTRYKRTRTPTSPLIDLGQDQCISLLKKVIAPLQLSNTIRNLIVFGASQGSATSVNYTAENPSKIKALILEAVLLTGNSTIVHNVFPNSTSSFMQYALPYLAKILFPFYAPAGKQPIFACDNLPHDLLVIILSAPNDPELDHADAQAFYAYLKNKGNPNIYFMPIEDGVHVNMLTTTHKETKAIQTILCKHGLLDNSKDKDNSDDNVTINLVDYQPEPKKEWLQHFNVLKTRELHIQHIDACVKSLFAITLSCLLYILITMHQ